MTKNANFVSHKKSKLKENGGPKLPLATDIVEGEIAINFGKDVETLSIKNESGDVVTFSSDNYYTEQKLGSGFTGENSGRTVTEALENIEITVDQVIDDTTSASTDAVSTSAVYDFVTSYTPSITVDQDFSNTASTNPISTKAVYSAVTDNELAWTNAFVALSGTVSAHTENTEIHVTAADKTTWNAKVDASAIANFFDDAKYEDSGTTKVINFYHGNTIKATIDASDFIKDGMVDNVVISGGSLVITFNTDSGKEAISIPLTDIFDPSNYYNKTEIDDLVGSGFTSSSITDVIIENEEIVSAALTDLDERKLDISAYTPTDLSNYYTKSETSGATELTTAFGGKLDISAYTPTDLSNYYTKSETSGATELTTAFSAKADTATTLGGYGITDAYTKLETSGATEISNALSNKADTATTLAGYGITDAYTKSDTSGATEISNALEGKVNTSDIVTVITSSNSGSTNPIATSVVAENELTVSAALTDLDERKLDASAYTPTDLSNYYTKSETSGATELADEFEKYYTKDKTSGATELAEAFANVEIDVDQVIDETTSGSSGAVATKAVYSFVTDELDGINDEIDEKLGSAFTESSVTEYIEDIELAISSSLNDLNARKLDASAYTPTDLSNYYTKDETSGATELSTEFAKYYTKSETSGASEIATEFAKYYTTGETSGATELATAFDAVSTSITDLSGQSETVSVALNFLNENKADLSAVTPVDLTNYYTKSETSGATELATAFGGKLDATAYTPTDLSNYYTKSETSGATELATAFDSKLDSSIYSVFSAATNESITQINSSITDLSGQSETVAAALNYLNENKADLSTTLSEYGITDAYTKTEIDNMIGNIETLLAAI